jgi:hypothetical protein
VLCNAFVFTMSAYFSREGTSKRIDPCFLRRPPARSSQLSGTTTADGVVLLFQILTYPHTHI